MENVKERRDSNVCGIIGMCLCVIFPLVGFILGIIALSRREKTKALGILAILISLIVGLLSVLMIVGLFTAVPLGY